MPRTKAIKTFTRDQIIPPHNTPIDPKDIEIALINSKQQASKAAHILAQGARVTLEHHSGGMFILQDEDNPNREGSMTTAQGIHEAMFKLYLISEAKKRGIAIDHWEMIPDAAGLVEVLWG